MDKIVKGLVAATIEINGFILNMIGEPLDDLRM